MDRKQNRKLRQLGLETLEPRQMMAADILYIDDASAPTFDSGGTLSKMMTTNIYLDFGTAFEAEGKTLPISQSEYPSGGKFDIPSLSDVSDLNSVEESLVSNGIDYDGDGVVADEADIEALSQDVLRLVQRAYEPFNVNVHIANAANWDDVADTLAAHDTNDVYVVVAGKGSGGAGLGISGDSVDVGNLNDVVAFTFANSFVQQYSDNIASDSSFLATGLAKIATHETGHAFGLSHLAASQPTVDYGGMMAGLGSYTAGADRVSVDGTIFRGWDMQVDLDPNSTQDDYQRLVDVLGTRPGGPAYVSGTSLNDIITIKDIGGDLASVTVRAYETNATRPYDQIEYLISTANGVLVEAGLGNDVVDARSLSAGVILRGGDGNDVLQGGKGDDVLQGEAGDDELWGGLGSDTYKFGFGAADQGSDTINEEQSYLYAYNASPNIDTLDFSEFRGPVTIDLGRYSASWSSRTYQRVGSSQDAQLRLALMEVWNIDPLDPGCNFIENVIGSEFDDHITGNWLNNMLDGRGGRDTLLGGIGNDELKGGDGRDNLYGGDGLDTLLGEGDADFLDGGADSFADVYNGGSGRDTFFSHFGHTRESFIDYSSLGDFELSSIDPTKSSKR